MRAICLIVWILGWSIVATWTGVYEEKARFEMGKEVYTDEVKGTAALMDILVGVIVGLWIIWGRWL